MKPFQTDSKCGLLDLQMQLTPTKLEPMEKKIGVKKCQPMLCGFKLFR